jgi:hypothetical protein
MGRTVEAVMLRSLAELAGCFALGGGFLADIRGEGDCFIDAVPFVWMPGGTGRLILEAALLAAAGEGVTGAMAT